MASLNDQNDLALESCRFEFGDEFALVIEDDDGNEIDRVDFNLYEDISGNVFPELDEFENGDGAGFAWTTGATPSVAITGIGTSKDLEKFKEYAAGKYRIDYTITFQASVSVFVKFYKDGVLIDSTNLNDPFDSPTSPWTNSVEIILDESVDTIVFDATNGAGATRSASIVSFEMVLLTYSYYASFVPSEIDVCNQLIKTKIVNVTTSPEVEEYKSDFLDIKSAHECTNQIEYSNHKNVLGLVFEDVSPAPTFYLRVHSTFFHEQFPTEQFSMELTSGYEKLSSSIKSQKKFETDYLPYYMHRKLKLIFMMQSILIDGYYWVQEEDYEIVGSDENKRWPVKTGSVFLTQRDFVQRSTL